LWAPSSGTTTLLNRRVAAALAFVATLAITPTSHAQSLDAARARAAELEDRIENGQHEAAALQSQLRALASAVGREQRGLLTIRSDLANTRRRVDAVKEELASVREQIGERARVLYMQGGPIEVVEVVLGAENIGEFIGRAAYSARVANRDQQLMLDAQKKRSELRAALAEQERIERTQADTVSALRSRQDRLTDAFARQQGVLADLARARSEALSLIAQLGSGLDNLRRVAGQGMTIGYGEWASAFLAALDAPSSRSNLIAVVSWEAAEGTQATWNPLATTKHMPGATVHNSHGVRNYISKAQGVEASVLTVKLPNRGYEPVIARLRAGAPAMKTAEAIRDSLWCRDCAGGTYVVGFIEAVTRYYERYAN
jgi:peptidoglycan hydrolase CwlO-like protein